MRQLTVEIPTQPPNGVRERDFSGKWRLQVNLGSVTKESRTPCRVDLSWAYSMAPALVSSVTATDHSVCSRSGHVQSVAPSLGACLE
jgi:hypothetical protein